MQTRFQAIARALSPIFFLTCTGALFGQGFWVGRTAERQLSMTTAQGRHVTTAAESGNFSGAASDGRRLWVSMGRDLQERSMDGRFIRSFAMREEFTDLAWDSKRHKLWAVFPDSQNLVRIEPATGRIEMEIGFSAVDPDGVLKYIRAIGLAYDPKRDRLYVSFCESKHAPRGRSFSCLPVDQRQAGLIQSFDPEGRSCETTQILFRTKLYTMGMAYDAKTDSIFVVSRRASNTAGYTIARYSITGTFGGEIDPYPHGYAFGLEYLDAVPKGSDK